MTDEAVVPIPQDDPPISRPRGIRLLWYILGGSLPARHHSWVLQDLTCRTWWLRHFARTAVIIVPLSIVL